MIFTQKTEVRRQKTEDRRRRFTEREAYGRRAASSSRWTFCLLSSVFCLLSSVFCSGCHRTDLVEAELRTKDNDLREMRAELARCEAYNCAMGREMKALRAAGGAKLSPEDAARIYTLRSIKLGRQTGGYDDDGVPGDEALQVVVEPQDPDGHSIKAPGTLRVLALEVLPEGVKKELSCWVVPPDELRRRWQNGLLSTGYFVVLPWKAWPTTDKLRVVAQFTLPDGRLFEADKDVTVRLVAQHRPTPRNVIEIPMDGPEFILPPPRKAEPPIGAMPQAVSAQKPANGVELLRPVPLRRAP
jgi:hypothetical protein